MFFARGLCKFEVVFGPFNVIIVSQSFVLGAVLEPSCACAGANNELGVVSVMATCVLPMENVCYFVDLFIYTSLLLRKLHNT